MLRISKLTDYGTVVMTELARNPRGVVSATDLASRLDITPATVSKLLKLLSKGKLVHSYRGSEGGYQLAQLPEDISVAAIIDVIEGPIALTECAEPVHCCSKEGECGVSGNWQLINRAVREALESVSLAEMVRPMTSLPLKRHKQIEAFASRPAASG